MSQTHVDGGIAGKWGAGVIPNGFAAGKFETANWIAKCQKKEEVGSY
jgi:hypothetical protein